MKILGCGERRAPGSEVTCQTSSGQTSWLMRCSSSLARCKACQTPSLLPRNDTVVAAACGGKPRMRSSNQRRAQVGQRKSRAAARRCTRGPTRGRDIRSCSLFPLRESRRWVRVGKSNMPALRLRSGAAWPPASAWWRKTSRTMYAPTESSLHQTSQSAGELRRDGGRQKLIRPMRRTVSYGSPRRGPWAMRMAATRS